MAMHETGIGTCKFPVNAWKDIDARMEQEVVWILTVGPVGVHARLPDGIHVGYVRYTAGQRRHLEEHVEVPFLMSVPLEQEHNDRGQNRTCNDDGTHVYTLLVDVEQKEEPVTMTGSYTSPSHQFFSRVSTYLCG